MLKRKRKWLLKEELDAEKEAPRPVGSVSAGETPTDPAREPIVIDRAPAGALK